MAEYIVEKWPFLKSPFAWYVDGIMGIIDSEILLRLYFSILKLRYLILVVSVKDKYIVMKIISRVLYENY
ncbi:hypothetical protein ULMA_06190 [Patiriisocius marinus]|uniref:Uncharacterized protein n=1 Tax=Patiriisocius marinus TaxID=1397112 RepID=A0A5J4IY48_9FLAO|nr:hypothetical protein ULMA_06190 [Patiriisocius marinus]